MLFCIEDEATPDIMVSPAVLSTRRSGANLVHQLICQRKMQSNCFTHHNKGRELHISFASLDESNISALLSYSVCHLLLSQPGFFPGFFQAFGIIPSL